MAIFVNPLRSSENSGGISEDFINNKLSNYVTKDTIEEVNEDFINNKLSNYVTKDTIEEVNEDFINNKLSNYVTKDTIGDTNKFGLVRLYTNSAGDNRSGLALSTDNDSGNPVDRLYVACKEGIKRTGSGEIAIDVATETDINTVNNFKPIVPSNLKYAVEKIVGIGNINQPGLVQLRTVSANNVTTNYSGLYLDSNNKMSVYCDENQGIKINDENGSIAIVAASEEDINAKTNSYKPIVPSNLEYAIKSITTTTKIYQGKSLEKASNPNKTTEIKDFPNKYAEG